MRRGKLAIATFASLLLVIRYLLTILKPKTFRVTVPLKELGEEEVYQTWQVIGDDGRWRDVTQEEMNIIQGFKGVGPWNVQC